jgi:hypothetical protein
MTTVGAAVSGMGFEDTPNARVCVVHNAEGGGKIHGTLDVLAEREISELGDVYVATGRFIPGTIFPTHGRTVANLADVVAIPLDFDLVQFLDIQDKNELYATPHATIDRYIDLLAAEVKDVLSLCAVPLSTLVNTGYGVLALSLVRADQRERIAEIRGLNAFIVRRVNETYGKTLADVIVKDAGTRIVRVAGCTNTKGVVGRPATLIERTPTAFIDIDAFPRMDTTHEDRVYESSGQLLPPDVVERIVNILIPLWNEGSRHGISLGVAGLFCKSGVTREQAIDIVERSARNDDRELANRIRNVETTYDRAAQGQSIAGFTGLSDLIPGDALRALGLELDNLYRATHRHISFLRSERGTPGDEDSLGGGGDAPVSRWTPRSALPPPESAFRGWFRDYRDVMAPCTEAPDAFHLGTALTMASVMIGRRAWAYQAGRNFPMLYTILVGETGGSKKDTAIRLCEDFFLDQHGGGEWFAPFATMYNIDTSQGLVNHLFENPVRLSINTEFARVLDQSRQEYAVNLLRQLTQLWDARPVEIARAHNPLRVESPTFSLLGAVTPQELADTMARKEILSGFANRVLFIYGSGRGTLDDPPPPDQRRTQELFGLLHQRVRALPIRGCEFRKTPDAQEYWREKYRAMKDRLYPTDVARYMAQRVGSNTFRVALCYAVAEGSAVIDQPHLEAAYAWVDWAYRNVSQHAETWGASEDARIANRIFDALALNGRMSKSDLFENFLQEFGPRKTIQTIDSLQRLGALDIDGSGVVEGRM